MSDAEILANPYRIYEADRLQQDAIAFAVVDRGLFPTEILRKEFPVPTPSLVHEAIARARIWFDDLISGKEKSIAAIAKSAGVSEIYVSNLLPVAFLSPAIVNAIIDGDQAPDLTSDALTKRINLPLPWTEQKSTLGN